MPSSSSILLHFTRGKIGTQVQLAQGEVGCCGWHLLTLHQMSQVARGQQGQAQNHPGTQENFILGIDYDYFWIWVKSQIKYHGEWCRRCYKEENEGVGNKIVWGFGSLQK